APGGAAVRAAAPRLIAVRSPVWERAEAHAQMHFSAAVDALRAAGATIEERELPGALARAHAVHKTIMYAEGARSFERVQRAHRPALSAAINALIDEGRAIADADLRAAIEARAALADELAVFLRD